MNPELPGTQHYDEEPVQAEVGAALADRLTDQEARSIGLRIGSIVLEDTVLREHQHDALEDLIAFFQAGGREGYMKSPTSTGKTVEFITLVDKYIERSKQEGHPARVAVLTPTTQLASQTVGSISKTGKRRGFKGFAPDLDARAVHSDMSRKANRDALLEAEVVSTTYNTFRNLIEAYVELEGTDPEDLRAMIAEHEAERPKIELDIHKHKADASQFLRQAYKDQLVGFLKEDVESYLKSDSISTIPKSDLALLKSTAKFLKKSKHDPNCMVRARRLIGRGMNQNVKDQFTKWQKAADEAAERSRIASKTGRQPKRGEPLLAPEEDIDIKLNSYEMMLAKFMWFSRFDRRTIREDLSSYDDRTMYDALVARAAQRRDALRTNKGKTEALRKKLQILETGLQFDMLVCDEAHRSIGTKTWDAIRAYAARKGIAVVGFTATDEYEDRDLGQYYGTLIHELKKEEAIERKLTNPVALFVHETGQTFDGVALDIKGDYDKLTMRAMRFNEERNNQAVSYAQQLSEASYSGAISAIPGDEGDHAKVLAEKINNTLMRDPTTGEMRYMKAKYILQNSKHRDQYLEEFEAGEIDWLVYVDVLREGWDSDRAKALINTRSTLSPLLAEQRLGRIGRLSEHDQVSIVIDFYDKILEYENRHALPTVLAADVFGLDDIDQGTIVGPVEKDTQLNIITTLKSVMPHKIVARYSRYKKALADMPEYNTGAGEFSSRDWKTLDDLQVHFRGYIPKEVLLDETTSEDSKVRVQQARLGRHVVPIFNVHDIERLHTQQPVINPWKLYIDPLDSTRWISPEGCTKLLSKKYPYIKADAILDAIRSLETNSGNRFERRIARVSIIADEHITRNGFTNLYKLDEIVERLVPSL